MEEKLPTYRDHFFNPLRPTTTASSKRRVFRRGAGRPRGALPLQQPKHRVDPASDEIQEGICDIARVCTALGMRYLQALVSGDAAGAALIAEQMEGST